MALEFKTKSKDAILPGQQALYVEQDGTWVLSVDGAVNAPKKSMGFDWNRSVGMAEPFVARAPSDRAADRGLRQPVKAAR